MATLIVLTLAYLLVSYVLTQVHNNREIHEAKGHLRHLPRSFTLPILMPVGDRPHYLRQVLEALSNVKDIEKSLLVVSQDMRGREVTDLIRAIRFTNVVILHHTRPFLGLPSFFWDSAHATSSNIFFLLEFAFSNTDARAAIVLEDDVVPSPDFLNYFEWATEHLLADDRVMTVNSFNIHSRVFPEKGYHPQHHPYDMVLNRHGGRDIFTGWGWAISRPMWFRVRKGWSFINWDIQLDKTMQALGLISYKPVLGRAIHIGMQQGINFTESEQNPKWMDLFISDEIRSYDQPPNLLTADPFIPPFEDRKPDGPIHNERTRNRCRRWCLLGAICLMTCLELFLLWIW